MTREQALNLGNQLGDVALLFLDPVPNKEQITQIISEAVDVAVAGASAGVISEEQRAAAASNIGEGFLQKLNTAEASPLKLD
jgi:predicted Zn-dependent peptidase